MEGHVQVRDIRQHVRRVGEGPLVILLHGNGEDHHVFDGVAPALADRYALVLPDSRAHGRSERGEGDLTIRGMGKDVLALMDSLDIASAVLIGFSDGGNVALEAALMQPGRVRGLLLMGANLYPGGVKPLPLTAMWLGYIGNTLMAPLSIRRLRHREMYGLMVRQPHIRPQSLKALSGVPCLVMAGERDMIRRHHTQLIARSIPGARMQIVAGSHFVMRDQPGQVSQAMLSFLDGIYKEDA